MPQLTQRPSILEAAREVGGGEEPETSAFKIQPLGSSDSRDILQIHVCGPVVCGLGICLLDSKYNL